MLTTTTTLAMASVAVGFVCIFSAYVAYTYRKPRALWVGLIVAAVLFLTLVPTVLAIFWAA